MAEDSRKKLNPESLKELNSQKLDDKIRDFVQGLSTTIDEAKTDRATWEQKIDRMINLRYGIRKPKTRPWRNAANFNIPLMDADISRLKPNYINLMNVTPIVNYVPYGPEDIEPARKREQLMDWRLRTQVKMFDQYNYGTDKELQDGAVVYKTLWKFKTNVYQEHIDIAEFGEEVQNAIYDPRMTDELLSQIIQEEYGINMDIDENVEEVDRLVREFREGNTVFDLNVIEITDDHPQVIARSLREDIVIPYDTILLEDNLDDARLIDDRIWRSRNDIKIDMRDGKYIEYPDFKIDEWADKGMSEDVGEPINDDDDMVLVHETCCWYDINDDGIEERCIVTWPDASPGDILRFIELPYDHGQWPYTLVKRELNDPGVYSSRGICELDEDYQVGISTELNQTIDNGTIVNTPRVKYVKNSISNIRNSRYTPGEPVEVKGQINNYMVEQSGNISQGSKLQIAQYLKGWANQRLGNAAAALSDQTNLSGSGAGGKKTAKEVILTAAIEGQAVSLDLLVHQMQMARVYYQIDALYDQFGSEDEYEIITGEKKQKINRREIQGRFNIVPNGRLDNSNPGVRIAKAQNLFIMFNGDPMIDQYELRKNLLEEFDMKFTQKILKSPEVLQQEAMQQGQVIQQKKGEKMQETVMMKKAFDELDINKEFVLSLFQGKKHSNKD